MILHRPYHVAGIVEITEEEKVGPGSVSTRTAKQSFIGSFPDRTRTQVW